MRKLILLSLLSTSIIMSSSEIEMDNGMPNLEELIKEGYVVEGYKSKEMKLNKRKKERLIKERIFESWYEVPDAGLEGLVVEGTEEALNGTNIYKIEEVEIRDKLIYKNGKLLNNAYIKNYYRNIKSDKKIIRDIVEIKDGYVEGLIREYGLNGKLKAVYKQLNNKIEGVVKLYDHKGRLREQSIYKSGIRDGNRIIYGTQGSIIYKIKYKSGYVEGKVEEYYKSGKLKYEAHYKKNKIEGTSNNYSMDGALTSKLIHDSGLIKEEALYNEKSGRIYNRTIYKEGKPYKREEYDYYGNNNKTIDLEEEKKAEEVKVKEDKIIPKGYILFEINERDKKIKQD